MFIKKFLFSLFLGLFINNVNVMAQDQGAGSNEAKLLLEGAKLYKDMISDLKTGMKDLFIADQLTSVAKSLAALNLHMDTTQRGALNSIVQVNIKCVLARDGAKNIASKLKNICDLVLVYLNSNADQPMMDGAVKAFITQAKTMEDPVKDAVTKLVSASNQAFQLDTDLRMLNSWARQKKTEILAMTKTEIAKARMTAYGPAAACVIAGPFALIACPVVYAIASGVTEGINVKQIEESFERGVKELAKVRKDINLIGTKTKQLVQRVEVDKARMKTVQENLDASILQGTQATINYKIFFTPFKNKVEELLQSCIDLKSSSK